MEKQVIQKKRVNIIMPQNMVDELDEIAEVIGANRSSLINMICSQYLDQRAVIKMSAFVQSQDNLSKFK